MTSPELQTLIESLRKTPEAVEQVRGNLRDDDLHWKPSEKEFSVVEHVCHLRDIEQEGYTVRIQRLLNESQPFLPDIDGDRLAEERHYISQSLDAALQGFARGREGNIRAIEGLTLEKLNRSGTMENVGPITLERLLQMMREHDQDHVKELNNLRGQLLKRSRPA